MMRLCARWIVRAGSENPAIFGIGAALTVFEDRLAVPAGSAVFVSVVLQPGPGFGRALLEVQNRLDAPAAVPNLEPGSRADPGGI